MKLAGGLRRTHLHFLLAVLAVMVARPDLAKNLVGTVIVMVGLMLRVWAAGVLVKGGGLCTSGLYSYVRHPLYLGSMIAAFGLAFMMNRGDWVQAAILGAFLGIYVGQALHEDRRLREEFGEAHAEWARHVPLLLSRLRAYRAGASSSWRWSHFLANREHLHLLITTALVALFYLKLYLLES